MLDKDVKTVTSTEETLQTNVESMRESFRALPDPRSTVNRKHSLDEIMVISVCAVLTGVPF
jgi:hypothetical protein|tara:strand:+ start:134 stop:316 length:183 start_codon:yes stop_codon:yes gene_type:complete